MKMDLILDKIRIEEPTIAIMFFLLLWIVTVILLCVRVEQNIKLKKRIEYLERWEK